jgi:hypothetical protein
MARKRRTSATLETTRQRLAGLKQINPAPDFGGNLNVRGGETLVADLTGELDGYNQDNAALDERQNVVDRKEDAANNWNKSILAAVGASHGTDSDEYEWSAAPAPANANVRCVKPAAAPSHQRLNRSLTTGH